MSYYEKQVDLLVARQQPASSSGGEVICPAKVLRPGSKRSTGLCVYYDMIILDSEFRPQVVASHQGKPVYSIMANVASTAGRVLSVGDVVTIVYRPPVSRGKTYETIDANTYGRLDIAVAPLVLASGGAATQPDWGVVTD